MNETMIEKNIQTPAPHTPAPAPAPAPTADATVAPDTALQTANDPNVSMVAKKPEAVMPGNVWADKDAFNQTLRMANMLAQSSLVPQNYQGKAQDCFIAIDMASRLGCSPIFVMQNLYVVKGKPSWAGQACMAIIKASHQFTNVRLNYVGKPGTDERGCFVSATRLCDGANIDGTLVNMAMAKGEGWLSNPKWKTMPEQMLGYRAASFFARLHCPEALMGLQTEDEITDVASAKVSDLTDILSGGDA